jgi:hypothetical protein
VTEAKRIAVLVRCDGLARVREALRAAVGLTLRGDRVAVSLDRAWLERGDPVVDRALATLRALGHEVATGAETAATDPRDCDAVEVWT